MLPVPGVLALLCLAMVPAAALGQTQSVRPGINRYYENPAIEQSLRMFESEGREVYDRRHDIVAALRLRPGMAVADVGAGTGLFTRLLAKAVAPGGRVYATDISAPYVQRLAGIAREPGMGHVVALLGGDRDAKLPPGSVDLVFTSDTYHHFEYPQDMLRSIHRALRPGGILVVVDYERMPGVSTQWVLDHVRAGREQMIAEIEAAGFRLVDQPALLRENYFLRFRRLDS
jgi:predicted methyltransferase